MQEELYRVIGKTFGEQRMDKYEYEIECGICDLVSWVTITTDQTPEFCPLCGSDAIEVFDLTED